MSDQPWDAWDWGHTDAWRASNDERPTGAATDDLLTTTRTPTRTCSTAPDPGDGPTPDDEPDPDAQLEEYHWRLSASGL